MEKFQGIMTYIKRHEIQDIFYDDIMKIQASAKFRKNLFFFFESSAKWSAGFTGEIIWLKEKILVKNIFRKEWLSGGCIAYELSEQYQM